MCTCCATTEKYFELIGHRARAEFGLFTMAESSVNKIRSNSRPSTIPTPAQDLFTQYEIRGDLRETELSKRIKNR